MYTLVMYVIPSYQMSFPVAGIFDIICITWAAWGEPNNLSGICCFMIHLMSPSISHASTPSLHYAFSLVSSVILLLAPPPRGTSLSCLAPRVGVERWQTLQTTSPIFPKTRSMSWLDIVIENMLKFSSVNTLHCYVSGQWTKFWVSLPGGVPRYMGRPEWGQIVRPPKSPIGLKLDPKKVQRPRT